MSDTTIKIMGRLQDNFTMVSNDFGRDPNVTPRAARLFLYIASHQTGWKLSITATENATGMKRGTIFAALKDLRALGYVKRYQVVDEEDRFAGTEYQVFALPLPESERDDVTARTDSRIRKNDTRDDVEKCDESAGEPRVSNSRIRENRIRKNDTLKKTNSQEHQPEEHQEEEHAQATPAPRAKRAHALPEGWMPDQRVIDQMRAECPGVDLAAEHRKFTDYFLSVAGERGRKKDWNAAWRNWIRRVGESPRGAQYRQESYQEMGERLAREMEQGDLWGNWRELEK